MYLLDTNAWSAYLRQRNSRVVARVDRESPSTLVMCSIVRAELMFGALKSDNPDKRLLPLHELCERVSFVDFDARAADAYGRIRLDLERRGQMIGGNDLLIASIAYCNSLVVVTHNTSEFTRVSGLTVEDWEL